VSARLAGWATGLAVLAVATIAAVVSYAHVESLALANGYTIGTARLLPLSVDGLIVASSLALANGARPWLARSGLILGILATVLANAVYGAGHGPVGVVVNMWPAVAFLLASEILLSMLRARPAPVAEDVTIPSARDTAEAVAEPVPVDVTGEAPENVPESVVEAVPASTVYPTREARLRTVAPAPATRAKRKPTPEKVFARELAAGNVPSLRAVKERMHVGTPAAREIRERLVAMIDVPEAA
jgi:hypothetical protein